MNEPAVQQESKGSPVSHVVDWIIAGRSESDIRETVAAHWPGVSVGDVLAEAVRYFTIQAQRCNLQTHQGLAMMRLDRIYREQMECGEATAAAKTVTMMVDLAEKIVESQMPDDEGE